MTELSRNSRNKGAFTDSGTGERSKEGPTHPYSGNQSDTPSQYSASGLRQSESPEDVDYNFEIALQYIMPLISTIKQENEHLKHEKTQIEGEMSSLQKLSQLILKENQQLRRHYSARTSDIKKLIETISINTHQEISDVNHQAFLLKESNCMIVKHIEGLMKELGEVDATNQTRRAELDQLAHKNIAIQKVNRDLKVKNKQLFYRCEKIKTEANTIDTTQYDEEINDLLSQVTALKNKNKGNIKRAKGLLLEHNEERPLLEENLKSLAAKNQELEGEAKDLEGKMKLAESASEANRQKYQQSTASLLKALKDYERSKTTLEEIEREIVQTRELTTQSILYNKKNQQTLYQLTHQKQKIKQVIAAKKQSLSKIQNDAREIAEQQESSHRQALKKIKDTISQQQSRANEQICSKISPESTMIHSSISESKEEFAGLVQEVDELRQTMSKWQNPIREIMRLEFELKKRRQKK